MFFEADLIAKVATSAATGTAVGLGHTFGQRFIPWVVNSWNWLFNRKKASDAAVDSLLRKVTLGDLSGGIPDGYQLCRYQNDALVATYTNELPTSLSRNETLLLVPLGEVWLETEFAHGDTKGEAEVAVEFNPEGGLSNLLGNSQVLERGFLATLIGGGLMGALASFGSQGAKNLLAGDPKTVRVCQEELDKALKTRGLRCKGLRTGQGDGTSSDSSLSELASEVEKVKNAADWQNLVASLQGAGVPFDGGTTAELKKMQDEVLQKTVAPQETVTRLAELTAKAFEKAGIGEPDLRRWQTLSEKLAEEAPEMASLEEPIPGVGVAQTKRPATWYVWSRQEVDRRQLQYTRRTIRHCRSACDRALATVRDLPALRQVRDLNGQLQMIEELLDTMPPLQARTSSLRIDTATVKTLLASLADAVLATERLAKQTDHLFNQIPSSDEWQTAQAACQRTTTQVAQLVRDRRTVR